MATVVLDYDVRNEHAIKALNVDFPAYFDLALNVEEKYKCQDWYGITDAEDDEEGIYSGEEVVRNAMQALINHHENQVFKNRPKAD